MAFRLPPALALTALLGLWSCAEESETCRCATPLPAYATPEPPELDPSLVLSEPLEVRSGHVSSASETLRGELSVSQSERGSSIVLQPSADGAICAAGKFDVVPDQGGDAYWGAQLALSLSDRAGERGWERGDVVGIAFDLSGTPARELWLEASSVSDPADTTHCISLEPRPDFTQAVRFDQLVKSCWNGPRGEPLPDGPVSQISWHLPASRLIASDFDFCIEDLRLLRVRED